MAIFHTVLQCGHDQDDFELEEGQAFCQVCQRFCKIVSTLLLNSNGD